MIVSEVGRTTSGSVSGLRRVSIFHLPRFEPRVGDYGAFFGEAFDVFGFFREITQRNKKRKIGVAMAGRAKHRIELALHVFPDPVAPRTNHHATAHVRGLSQFGGANHLLIPFRKIFVPPRRDRSLSALSSTWVVELSAHEGHSPAGI